MNRKRETIVAVLFVLAMALVCAPRMLYAHCEIPCGIYNDQMRIDMIQEDITTIEKSMNQIILLSKQENKNYNQLVRWIQNKDEHADKIANVVTQYFMTQRLKPVSESETKEYRAYQEKLSLLHNMLIHSMKAKQTLDLDEVKTLQSLLDRFSKAYLGK